MHFSRSIAWVGKKGFFYLNSAVSRFLIGWCAVVNKSPHNGADVINSCLHALTSKYCGKKQIYNGFPWCGLFLPRFTSSHGQNLLRTHSAAPRDAISRTKRALPYPARMSFSRSIAWIGKKVMTYYLKTSFFPISANLAVFCRSVRRLNTRAG